MQGRGDHEGHCTDILHDTSEDTPHATCDGQAGCGWCECTVSISRIMPGYAAMQRADTESCDVATGDNSNCTAESRQVSRP